ncbi:hypothetical protein [Roseateles sp.]|uniref:hypothetical protein n=1 Tax=Roseateles sp. TaxID=1971397 RepID=UPI0032638B7E
MRFPTSTHSEGWHTHLHQLHFGSHDSHLSTSRERRGLNVLIAIAVVGGLLASSALAMADDPRPLDVQLASAMREAGTTLKAWEQQLSRGLQVSLRAVADGREAPALKPKPASAQLAPARP